MLSAPRLVAPMWLAPHPTELILGVRRLDPSSDRTHGLSAGADRACDDPACGDTEAVLARAALRKSRVAPARVVSRSGRVA